MTAEKIIVVAVNDKGEKSEPVRVYQVADGKKLPKQFVLKVEDAGINDNGIEQTKLNNGEFSLIVTNGTSFLDERLTGFRRRIGADVFLLCEVFKADIYTVKSVTKPDEIF